MTIAVVVASSLLTALLTFAWAREWRVRRALQSLLAKILSYRSKAYGDEPSNRPGSNGPDHVVPAGRGRM